MMAYFLDQENAAAWTAVQDLANANGSKADKKLRRWVVEVQRTAVDGSSAQKPWLEIRIRYWH